MKPIKIRMAIIFAVFLFKAITSFGQKNEVNVNLYSGIFAFRGKGATINSSIDFNPYTSPSIYTTNPFGRKSKFSYAIEIHTQRILKNSNIIGVAIGYENGTSKVHIDTVTQNGFLVWVYAANGKTTMKNTFIGLNPYFGHRYKIKNVTFDLLAGVDFAIHLKGKEIGYAILNNNKEYEVSYESVFTKPFLDLRPRVEIKTTFTKISFLTGYSFGVTNYQTQNNKKVFSSILRIGLGYQIK